MNTQTIFEYRGRTIEIVLGKSDDENPGYYRGSRILMDGSPACCEHMNGTLLATQARACELIDKVGSQMTTNKYTPIIEKFHAGPSMAYSYYEFGHYRIYDETASRVAGYRVMWANEQIGFKPFYTDAVDLCARHHILQNSD